MKNLLRGLFSHQNEKRNRHDRLVSDRKSNMRVIYLIINQQNQKYKNCSPLS